MIDIPTTDVSKNLSSAKLFTHSIFVQENLLHVLWLNINIQSLAKYVKHGLFQGISSKFHLFNATLMIVVILNSTFCVWILFK